MKIWAGILLGALVASTTIAQASRPWKCIYQAADGEVREGNPRTLEVAFSEPTTEYGHAVFGDAAEYRVLSARFKESEAFVRPSKLDVVDRPGGGLGITFSGSDRIYPIVAAPDAEKALPLGRVFEDIAPRPFHPISNPRDRSHIPYSWDYDYFVVVEADTTLGAQLAIYRFSCGLWGQYGWQKIAATPHIGKSYRWLAPAGIADFDGDGKNDIAYVETPHLGKILKIVTLKGDQLPQIVPALAGFSNHKIGQDFITSGVRRCDGRTELLTPNADWTALMAVRIEDGEIVANVTTYEPSLDGIAQAQRCN